MTENLPPEPAAPDPAGPANAATTEAAPAAAPTAEAAPAVDSVAPPTGSARTGRPPLVRDRSDRLLGGVCAALARHLGVDANVVRLGLVVLVFAGGAGLLAYLAGWILIPAEGEPRDTRAMLRRGAIVVGVLVLCGALVSGSFLAAAFGGAVGVAIAVILAGAVIAAIGLRRRALWLALPALCLAVPAAAVGASGLDLRGGVGDREIRPATLADLQPRYELGAGSMVVDLRGVDFAGRTQRLRLDLGVGDIEVRVPPGTCVGGRTRIGAGEVRLLDRDNAGVDIDVEHATPVAAPGGRLVLDTTIGMGALSVRTGAGDEFGPGRVTGGSSAVDRAGCAA